MYKLALTFLFYHLMKLLLTGAFRATDKQIRQISDMGFDVSFLQYENDELPLPACDVDCVVCNSLFLHHNIDDFANLKLIQLTSAGLDRIPIDKISKHGIALYNARGVYSIPMAEWALCKVLDVYKGTTFALNCQSRRLWDKNRKMRELSGKEVAVLGAGNVGSEVAVRFKAMGANVTGYDIAVFDTPAFNTVKHITEFKTEVADYDIIIITLPLTNDTIALIDKKILAVLREDAVIVNISRGGVIEEAGLVDILRQRTDVTAILDVFESEPLSYENELWTMPNVIISPHNSFVSDGNAERLFNLVCENLSNFANAQL